jgi:hypothetical protein
MGNQLNKISSISNAKKKGFIQVNTNLDNSLSENEFYGFHLENEPEKRDYYIKCSNCEKIIIDYGLNEVIECDSCHTIIEISDNNFNEIKKELLFLKNNKKKCVYKCKNYCSIISKIIPFSNKKTLNTESYKSINLLINKDKIPNVSENKNVLNLLENNNNQFTEIINNIILPFFQFKSRIINKGKIFSIGEYEFKVSSTYPNLINGKVTSETLIRCNEYYSNIIPIKEATFITCKNYENESNEEIKEKIYLTPYKNQLSIYNNSLTRINSYDFFIRNCYPSFGVINNETIINIKNKNIEQIRSVTLAIILNENPIFNDRKNQNIIIERFYKPNFLSGMNKYIERGDIISFGNIKFFVLKSHPENGFINKNTKTIFKYGKTEQQLINRLNNDREIERERILLRRNNNNHNNNHNHNHNRNNRNNNYNERIRLINEFIDRDLYFEFDENEFFKQQKIESIIRGLPKFKVDKIFLDKIEKLDDFAKKCIICMEEYKLEDECETLPCFHIFHGHCIEEWFNNNNNNCPVCKNDISNDNDIELN